MPEPGTFDCVLGEYTRRLQPTSEADPAGILGTFVTATSAIIGAGPSLQVGDSRHPLTVWTLLAGRTAAGRKGTAEAAARRVLAQADPDFFQNNILSGLSSAEGVIAAVADEDVEDSAVAAVSDKRRLIVEPEFGVVLARAKREGNALVQVLREAWDGRDLRVQTKVPLVATAPHLALTGHVTPDEFRARISQRDLAGGSYNRFLMIFVERSKRLPDGGGAAGDLVAELAADLRRRLDAACRLTTVQRAASTTSRWHDLYHELIDLEDDPVLQDWVARAIPYTLRVAGLYAVLDGTDLIHNEHLDAAAALIRYSMASVRAVMDDGTSSLKGDGGYLAKLIADAGEDGVTRSALTKAFATRGGARALDAALADVLEMPGFVAEEVRTGGRPSTRFVHRAAAPPAALLSSFFPDSVEVARGA